MCPLKTRRGVSVYMCRCVFGGNVIIQSYAFGACERVAFLCLPLVVLQIPSHPVMFLSFVSAWLCIIYSHRPLREPALLRERQAVKSDVGISPKRLRGQLTLSEDPYRHGDMVEHGEVTGGENAECRLNLSQ